MQHKSYIKGNKEKKGISLITVLLIGSILMLVSISSALYATRAIKSADVRSEFTSSVYTGQSAFECVKHWVRKDKNYFYPTHPAPAPYNSITCSDNENINITDSTEDGDYQVYTFEYAIGESKNTVEVRRDTRVGWFLGTIIVHAESPNVSTRGVARYQEHTFEWPRPVPADIMFVIDRSGSIEGGRDDNNLAGNTDEWGELVSGLAYVVNDLVMLGSPTQVGYVSFGSSTDSVGRAVPGGRTSETGLIEWDDGIENLINAGGVPVFNNQVAHTNISLGLAVAGTTLMDRKYPLDPTKLPTEKGGTGSFEYQVAQDTLTYSDLPEYNTGDRNDTNFPDFIILITDGQPNALISYEEDLVARCFETNSLNEVMGEQPISYAPGDVRMFQVSDSVGVKYAGTGCFVYDDDYETCDDGSGDEPKDGGMLGPSFPNKSPNQAKCNATKIARALGDNDITIGVIGVGDGIDEKWLQEHIASQMNYYVKADTYYQILESLEIILAEMKLLKWK